MTKINYAGPDISTDDADFVRDAVLNGYYENYRKHAQLLENRLCEYLNVKHAYVTNSCTAAIHLALASIDLDKDDEVITTDSSCVASAMPILYSQSKAVFVDVKKDDWNLDPKLIESQITERTKAIIAVHWNGHPCAIDQIVEIARRYDLKVIEDAAPALGAEFAGKKVGTIGDLGCFSFQGAKIAIGGQGGAIVTNDSSLYEKIMCLASYGRTDSKMQYWSDHVGWNYSMPNLPAALAYSQMSRMDELLTKKRAIFEIYLENLKDSKFCRVIEPALNTKSTYCYPSCEITEEASISRKDLLMKLNELNIDARPAQPRISRMPMFSATSASPNSKYLEENGFILPGAFNLAKEDVVFVCNALKRFLK